MKILSKYSLHVREANRTQNGIAGCQNFYSFNSSKSLNFGGIVLDKGKQLHADYEMSYSRNIPNRNIGRMNDSY